MFHNSLDIIACGYSVVDRDWSNCQPHWHHCYKYFSPIDGSAQISIGPKTFALQPHNIYFIPSFGQLQYDCEDSLSLYWIHFQPRSLRLQLILSRIRGIIDWPRDRYSQWQSTYMRLPEFQKKNNFSLLCRIEAMLLDFISDLVQFIPDSEFEKIDRELAQFHSALAYMDYNFRSNPALNKIARLNHMHPSYFQHRFTELFGISAHEYMLGKRMSLARQLLGSGNLSVQAVAQQSGYENQFYFSRVFKKYYGITPQQGRNPRIFLHP